MYRQHCICLGLGVVAPREDDHWIRSGIPIAYLRLGIVFSTAHYRTLLYLGQTGCWFLFLIQLGCWLVITGPPTKQTDAFQCVGWNVQSAHCLSNWRPTILSRAPKLRSHQCGGNVEILQLRSILGSEAFHIWIEKNHKRNRRTATPLLARDAWAHMSVGPPSTLRSAVVLKTNLTIA